MTRTFKLKSYRVIQFEGYLDLQKMDSGMV